MFVGSGSCTPNRAHGQAEQGGEVVRSHDEWEFPWADVLDDSEEHRDETDEAEAVYFTNLREPSEESLGDFEPPPVTNFAAGNSSVPDSSGRLEAAPRQTEPTLPASQADESAPPAFPFPGPWPLDLGPPLLPLLVVMLVLLALAL
jgi:hypothetical protein